MNILKITVLLLVSLGVNANCKIFDATSFVNKPHTGMYSINLWHHNWGDHVPENAEGRWVIDKEDLFMNTVKKVDLYAYTYAEAVSLFKENNPDASVGFYSVLPVSRYRSLANWEVINDKLKALSDQVDYIYPSLYTFHNAPMIWRDNAIDVIAEAKRYDKKVYPFIWPLYHGANKALAGSEVDREFWKLQLETVCEHADGVVIWDWHKTQWDGNAPWWLVTKGFIK